MLWANAQPMDCEERLIEQVRLTKAANPATKVWVYRSASVSDARNRVDRALPATHPPRAVGLIFTLCSPLAPPLSSPAAPRTPRFFRPCEGAALVHCSVDEACRPRL
jgi:hypothetical protein